MKAELIPCRNREYKESNFIICSKSKKHLLDSKILSICLYYIDHAQEKVDNENDVLQVSIKVANLKKMLGKTNSGSIYDSLKKSARRLTEQTIYVEDINNPKQNFKYINLISSAESKDGTFVVNFNRQAKAYLLQIKKNYSIYSIDLDCAFTNKYAFFLYRMLKARCYYPKGKSGPAIFRCRILVSELKLELGIVDAAEEGVRKILDNSKCPDYDEAVAASRYDPYVNYHDFSRFVLNNAIEEVNILTDMEVKIEDVVRQGIGGKVSEVIFLVDFEKKKQQKEIPDIIEDSPHSKDEVLEMISDLIDEPLKIRQIKNIAEAADYNYEKVKKAYEIAGSQKKDIENLTGFLIAAIKNNYEKGPEKEAKNNSQFLNIEQHDYDFEELEKIALKHSQDNLCC